MSRIGSLLSKAQNTMLKHNYYALLNSRFLLYFILLLSVVDLYVFSVNGELFYVALFILIGFLTTFFSKNMSVILFVAMSFTNILRFGKDIRVKEGLEDNTAATTTATTTTTPPEGEHHKEDLSDDDDDEQYLSKDGVDSATKKTQKKPDNVDAAIPKVEADMQTKIAGLDQDTADLLQKQKKLIENMDNLNPLLQNAEKFLERFKKTPPIQP
jgi:hypothetical protein